MADQTSTPVFEVKDLVAGGSLAFYEGDLPKDAIVLDRGFGFHTIQDRADGLKTAVLKGVLAAIVAAYGDHMAPGSTDEMLVKAIYINGEPADQAMVQRLRRTTIAKIGGRVQDTELLALAKSQAPKA